MNATVEQPSRVNSFAQYLQEKKKVNIYFLPGHDRISGQKQFAYIAASSYLHNEVLKALAMGVVPDFAVVVEHGDGDPSPEIKAKIKHYYGFDHDGATAIN